MKKIIIDTNVMISAIFFGGKPLKILDAWKQKKFKLIISHDILTEYFEVAEDLEKKYTNVNAMDILKTIASDAELSLSLSLPTQICEDKDDDKFLACALASKTKIIISGDKHLKKVSGWSNITVYSPNDFVENYLK